MAPSWTLSNTLRSAATEQVLEGTHEYVNSLVAKNDVDIMKSVTEDLGKFLRVRKTFRKLSSTMDWVYSIYEKQQFDRENPVRSAP